MQAGILPGLCRMRMHQHGLTYFINQSSRGATLDAKLCQEAPVGPYRKIMILHVKDVMMMVKTCKRGRMKTDCETILKRRKRAPRFD